MRLNKRIKRLRRRLRSWILRPFVAALTRLVGTLSWRRAQALGSLLGRLAWALSRRDRRRALAHLEIAFPHLVESDRRHLARASFRHLGTSVIELLHALGRPLDDTARHLRFEGVDIVRRLREAGRPILLLTGHCGNWELISIANHTHGVGFAAMARKIDEAAFDALIVGLREHFGTETIARGSRTSSRQLLRALRSGKVLAMLIDQDIRNPGVWVPFFGRLAHTPPALADLARRLDAAVVPAFDARQADGSHRIVFQEPLDLPTDAVEATARMTEAIELQIRRHPEQWVWFHRRWRRRPPEDGDDPSSGASPRRV
ncbi:MAG: lysophospholipid acyltransferase family protein [Acidobacteriota bacterium]